MFTKIVGKTYFWRSLQISARNTEWKKEQNPIPPHHATKILATALPEEASWKKWKLVWLLGKTADTLLSGGQWMFAQASWTWPDFHLESINK